VHRRKTADVLQTVNEIAQSQFVVAWLSSERNAGRGHVTPLGVKVNQHLLNDGGIILC
jgi:hypothetical protein